MTVQHPKKSKLPKAYYGIKCVCCRLDHSKYIEWMKFLKKCLDAIEISHIWLILICSICLAPFFIKKSCCFPLELWYTFSERIEVNSKMPNLDKSKKYYLFSLQARSHDVDALLIYSVIILSVVFRLLWLLYNWKRC